ncbi:hypothetical protein [Hydrocarboniphaga effusa]|uniref:hypothetical protein n=1 Tax=Hydrocarboniphaga effusa TaxID=243629 RepID=UPI00398C0387
MNLITYTFPNDFRHAELRGKTLFGGKAIVRGGASLDGSEVTHQPLELGIVFEGNGRGQKPISIAVSRYPALRDLAAAQVLATFAVSDTHGIARTEDGFGKIRRGKQDVNCSVRCSEQSEADGWEYSQVFAVIKHPEHGFIGVTRLEFAALGLPEVAGWRFLDA